MFQEFKFLSLVIRRFAILLASGIPAYGQAPLPQFTFQGIALQAKDLSYAPTEQLIHPTLVKTDGRIQSPLGTYYLYYAPHKHIATSMAYSKDAKNWVQLKKPLVEPIEDEMNDCYGPALLRWQGRNFVVYQDHSVWRGGNIKYVEVDSELNPVGPKGERFVLLDPSPDPPLKDRYRGGEFYLEGETLFLYSSASSDPRIIVYATASAVTPMASRRNSLKAGIERDRSRPVH